jgi:hypothetical protein
MNAAMVASTTISMIRPMLRDSGEPGHQGGDREAATNAEKSRRPAGDGADRHEQRPMHRDVFGHVHPVFAPPARRPRIQAPTRSTSVG